MVNQITVNVVSAEREIWSGKADMLVAKTEEGGFLSMESDVVTVVVRDAQLVS